MTKREKDLTDALRGILAAVTWGGANVGDQAKIELTYNSPEIRAAQIALINTERD